MIQDSREKGWRRAADVRFKSNANMHKNILDGQRASWLPLLPCPPEGRALDIGSGYGNITHALAQSMAEVYSLEAVTERIEFTQLRLQQEGIRNVHLIQGSALELPFPNDYFDLIVVNGVLEWVGEWEHEGNPRSVQLRFLRRLRELLTPTGVLLIGIENRFGAGSLRGALDHSALAYTSLMPRKLASLYLRWRLRSHHRTKINPRREYRTYTYTRSGYKKLLRQGGFDWTRFYWADPGYNQPYSLVPIQTQLIRQRFERTLASLPFPRAKGHTFKNRIKGVLISLGFFNWIVPDFLILAAKASPFEAESSAVSSAGGFSLPASLDGQDIIWVPSTASFGDKTVVFGVDGKSGKIAKIAKISTAAVGSADILKREYQNLSIVYAALNKQASPSFVVSEPQGSVAKGPFTITLESPVAGVPLSRLALSLPQGKRVAFLAQFLPSCLAATKQVAEMLDKTAGITSEASSKVQPFRVQSANTPEAVQEHVPSQQETRRCYSRFVQHGDFTLENIFWDASSSTLSVIDWRDLRRGLPPLYDVVTLLISVLPLLPENRGESLAGVDGLQARFIQSFFGKGPMAGLVRQAIQKTCENAGIPPQHAWEMFLDSLLLRVSHYRSIGNPLAENHSRFLQFALQNRPKFVFQD